MADEVATFGSEGLNRVTEPQPAPEVNQEQRMNGELKPGGPIKTPPAPEVHYGHRQNLPAGPGIQTQPIPEVDYSTIDSGTQDPADITAERAHAVVDSTHGNDVPPEYPEESRGLYQGDMPQTAKAGPEPEEDEAAKRRRTAEDARQQQADRRVPRAHTQDERKE